MKQTNLSIHNRKIKTYFVNTLVVGSGAAGYAAAVRLWEGGNDNIALLTENRLCGTSRNAGSDKQTYYKQGIGAMGTDSPMQMAKDLFAGGAMDGDTAYCEAVNSLPCFFRLSQMGVSFPTNRYGEFVGYRTDHDTAGRATSAGPLTSKMMTEAWEKQFEKYEIPLLDNLLASEILKDENGAVCGVFAIRTDAEKNEESMVLIGCSNCILATGGHAAVYADTVYPDGHTGSLGLAVQAGAKMQNLTEWQYGLASVNPKWNVSGTYMQSLPALISTDENGNRTDILQKYIPDIGTGLSLLFRKGYEWPFDSAKAENGSSQIDLLVHKEKALGKRVYLDYTVNPYGENFDLSMLDTEAKSYLENANALLATPLKRLLKMNTPAYELYFGKGVDLAMQPLEIALCAQHCNGGVAVDVWWQSSVEGLFVCGEAAGTHGVRRPGGSALNAGQVGALRAAQFINAKRKDKVTNEQTLLASAAHLFAESQQKTDKKNSLQTLASRVFMSEHAGAIRNADQCRQMQESLAEQLLQYEKTAPVQDAEFYRCRHALFTQCAQFNALCTLADHGIVRGGAVWTDVDPTEDNTLLQSVVETQYKDGDFVSSLRAPRPLPDGGGFFEEVWRSFRENGNVE
ncbi:MAG: FAD-binding protein [Ruminococcaceae bacterium]|nr:FAD-binding protein [Oscillospiraceae bacterium]